MKWIILVVLLLIVVGALYLRTVRDRPAGRGGAARPHRLDDSLTPSHGEGLATEAEDAADIPDGPESPQHGPTA